MPEIKIPCPTDGCAGVVFASFARGVNGGGIVQWVDDDPQVYCTNDCRTPLELEGPVNEQLAERV
ncbi:hypothetical protein GCM10027053_46510 [Intrasporangium mesophilum]